MDCIINRSTKLGGPGCPLSGSELIVMKEGVRGAKLKPLAGPKSGKPGAIPDVKRRTSDSKETQLYTVVEHKAKCGDVIRPAQNVLLWSTDPEGACIQKPTPAGPASGVNLSYLLQHNPSVVPGVLRDAFTNLPKYIPDHSHYLQGECKALQGQPTRPNWAWHRAVVADRGDRAGFEWHPSVALPAYSTRDLPNEDADMPGVKTPYFYANQYGSRSVFSTHNEDMMLPSVNTVIHGDPKLWLTVAPAHESIVQAELLGKWAPPSGFTLALVSPLTPQSLFVATQPRSPRLP